MGMGGGVRWRMNCAVVLWGFLFALQRFFQESSHA
jgi:hypothetical protein